MTDTSLALLSEDNVLRLVKKNGKGVEELAAVALGHEYTVSELLDFCSMLTTMTAKDESKAKAEPKLVKPTSAKAKKSERKKRRPNHTWLNSGWLIRYVDAHPGQRASIIGKGVCAELGKEYVTANQGDAGVISSRLSNLVAQKKLARGDDGLFFSTPEGLEWAAQNTPGSTEGAATTE